MVKKVVLALIAGSIVLGASACNTVIALLVNP